MPERKKPFFSICIPVYNMASTIGLSIESVLHQTCDDWELVIVDDCSTDGTWEYLLREYVGHPKISLHRNEENLKQWGNLNRCLELATGQWLGLLPADDAYRLHALETIKREVQKRAKIILWMHAHLCHGKGIVSNIIPVYNQAKEFDSLALSELLYLKGNLFGELSSFFVSLDAMKCNPVKFRDCSGAPDLDFYVRYLRKDPEGVCIYWPDVLALVLQHPSSVSSIESASGRVFQMVIDSTGELGHLGWRTRVVWYQRLRVVAFFVKNFRMLPENRWRLLGRAMAQIKDSGG